MTFPWEKLEGAYVRVTERCEVSFFTEDCEVSFSKLYLIQHASDDGILSTMAWEGSFQLHVIDPEPDCDPAPEVVAAVDMTGAMFKAQVVDGKFDVAPLSAGVPVRAEVEIWYSGPVKPADVEALS